MEESDGTKLLVVVRRYSVHSMFSFILIVEWYLKRSEINVTITFGRFIFHANIIFM